MKQIAVITGNYLQFKDFLFEIELNDRPLFKYIESPFDIVGKEFSAAIRTGDWRSNPNAKELFHHALTHVR